MASDTSEDMLLRSISISESTTKDEERRAQETQDQDKSNNEQHQAEGNESPGDGHQSPDSNQKGDKATGGDEDDPAPEMEEQDNMDAESYKEKDAGDSDLDDSDDDINVVIGDINSGPTYNIKQRPNLLAPTAVISQEKIKQSAGKFNIEEFESVGKIKSVPAQEFTIDSLEEKPWRKPGADITDYFNYGFSEDTWESYCKRQKRIRLNHSRVGLQGHTQVLNTGISKSSESPNSASKPEEMSATPPKENAIQVLITEYREYSRPGNNNAFGNEYFEPDGYNYGYEPTQDSQWANYNTHWTPRQMQQLTLGPQMIPPPMGMHPAMFMEPPMRPPMGMPPPPHNDGMVMMSPMMIPPGMDRHRDRARERRDRDRDRWAERGRVRERDRERERVRERDWDIEREREGRGGKSEEVERNPGSAESTRQRERRRERHRDRDRERSTRRECSRTREKSRRWSRSRDRERKTRDKKKSDRKDKEDSE